MKVFFLSVMQIIVMVMLIVWGRQTVLAVRMGEEITVVFAVSIFAVMFALYGFAAWFKKRGKI